MYIKILLLRTEGIASRMSTRKERARTTSPAADEIKNSSKVNSSNPGPNGYDRKLLEEVEKIPNLRNIATKEAEIKEKEKIKEKAVRKDKAPKEVPLEEGEPSVVDEETEGEVDKVEGETQPKPHTIEAQKLYEKTVRAGSLNILHAMELISIWYGVNVAGLTIAMAQQETFGELVTACMDVWAPTLVEGVKSSPTLQLCFLLGSSAVEIHTANLKMEAFKKEHAEHKIAQQGQNTATPKEVSGSAISGSGMPKPAAQAV